MKIKLDQYINDLSKKIDNNKIDKNLDEEVYKVICFFQHERLVHLIVTFFTGISTILFLLGFLAFTNLLLLLLFVITMLLFIPYIFHYYYLENGVQKLYDLYLEIYRKK